MDKQLSRYPICPKGGAGGDNAAAGAPAPENFKIQTSRGVPAAVTAIVPYAPQPDLYLVQVRAPRFLRGFEVVFKKGVWGQTFSSLHCTLLYIREKTSLRRMQRPKGTGLRVKARIIKSIKV